MEKTEVIFDFSKLRGLMREKGITQDDLAEKINISPTSLSYKLNSKVAFSPKELLKIQRVLEISDNNFKDYFFSAFVRKVENPKQPA